MNIALVIDCWAPQVNGVVRTYTTTVAELRRLRHEVLVIGPDRFRTVRCPTDGEYRLALGAGRAVARLLEAFQPNAVHIATEGPLGLAARNYCLRRGAARRFFQLRVTRAQQEFGRVVVAAGAACSRESGWPFTAGRANHRHAVPQRG